MKAAYALLAALLLSSCGTETVGTPAATSSQLGAVVIASELVTGTQQRVPIGILDHNTPVSDAAVHVRAFLLQGSTSVLKGESDAPFKGQGLEGAGAYVAHLDLDVAGSWGLEVTVSRPNGQRATLQLATFSTGQPLVVVTNPTVPAVGQPAPLSQNPTVRDVSDATYIDSGRPPDDMHQVSIADAIQQHRPTLVVFASPAFCTSQTCGPEVKVVQSLEPGYKDRVTFIHVEIYKDFVPDPSKRSLAQTVLDWRLPTDPWVFLIDSKGIIQSRFEGPTAVDEVKAAIDQLLH